MGDPPLACFSPSSVTKSEAEPRLAAAGWEWERGEDFEVGQGQSVSGVIGRLLPGGLWVGKLARLIGAVPSSFPRRGCGAWAEFWLPK